MAEEFNLSVENEVYDISFNEETSEIIVDIQDNVTAINVDFHQGYYPLPNEGSGSSDWNDITNKPSTFPPSAHTHPISEVTNLQTTLDNKVDKVIGKQLSTEDYTTAEKNKLAGIQSGAEVNVNADWNAISGDAHILNKPSTFTPSTHTHEISDINNLQVSLENKLDKPTSDGTYLVKKTGDIISYEIFSSVGLSNYYTKTETYSQTEINGFLSGKQNSIGYTPENVENKSDSYTISSSTTYASTRALVDGLANKLDKGTYTGTAQDLKNSIDSKANTSHTHDISNVTNLQTTLNNKLDKGSLTSNDDSLLVEGENIEVQLSIYSEEFEQKTFNLTFTPINILGVYKNGIYLRSSEFILNLPKSITINNYNTNDIVIVQYQHLKTDI